jgi:hypothetical protein
MKRWTDPARCGQRCTTLTKLKESDEPRLTGNADAAPA